jgi:hypothetical protein
MTRLALSGEPRIILKVDGWLWSFPGATVVSDSVVRSQSGLIIQNKLSDLWVADPRTETSTYTFDATGRLT